MKQIMLIYATNYNYYHEAFLKSNGCAICVRLCLQCQFHDPQHHRGLQYSCKCPIHHHIWMKRHWYISKSDWWANLNSSATKKINIVNSRRKYLNIGGNMKIWHTQGIETSTGIFPTIWTCTIIIYYCSVCGSVYNPHKLYFNVANKYKNNCRCKWLSLWLPVIEIIQIKIHRRYQSEISIRLSIYIPKHK